MQLRGFRPGKVPVAHLKRLYGKSAMAEVIEAAVREANSKIVTDHGFKLATEPKVVLPTEEGAVEGVIAGKADLAYTVEIEIVPPITLADFKTIKLERLTAPVDRRRDRSRRCRRSPSRTGRSSAKTEGAEKGDRVTVSFQGTHGRRSRSRAAPARMCRSCLGSGQFIPGFEDHLIGIKAGESRTFDVKFPDELSGCRRGRQRRDLRGHGKDGRSARRRHDGRRLSPRRSAWNRSPSCAKRSRERIEREHAAASRQKLKRALLDQLDARHKFEPPPTPGRAGIQQRLADDRERSQAAEPHLRRRGHDRGKGPRRIPRASPNAGCGSVWCIAEIGEKNNIKVTDEQLTPGRGRAGQQVPGQEQQVWDYYRNNPGALAALRAPMFEDKVVDFLLELADVTDKQVSREELFKEDEE